MGKCIKCNKKRGKKYRIQNELIIKKQQKNWRDKNKAKLKQYRIDNKNKRKIYRNRYKQREITYAINRINKLRKSSKEYRLKERISNYIRFSLIKINKSKNNISYKEYINFTIQQLVLHLENQFDQNMNWDNHGSYWHIDHIIPISLYDYTNLDEIKKSWDLNNLRPLEAKENISKGNKLDWNLIKDYNLYDMLPKGISVKI